MAGLYATLEKNGVPARARKLVHSVFRRALRRAVAWKLKGFNPAADVERPKVTRRDIPAMTPEQANALLDAAAGHRLEALFVCAVACGRGNSLRCGGRTSTWRAGCCGSLTRWRKSRARCG